MELFKVPLGVFLDILLNKIIVVMVVVMVAT